MLQECPELLRMVLARHGVRLLFLNRQGFFRVLRFAVQRSNDGALYI